MIMQVVVDLDTNRIAKFTLIEDSIFVGVDSVLLCILDYEYSQDAKAVLVDIYPNRTVRGEAGVFIQMKDAQDMIAMIKENHYGTRLATFMEVEQEGNGRLRDVLSKA